MTKGRIIALVFGVIALSVGGIWFASSSESDLLIGISDAKKPYRASSGTMIPNIFPGDIVMAVKLTPPEERAPFQPGAVVVFFNSKQNYEQLGRIIATGGDRVRLIGGVVHINDEPLLQKEIRQIEFDEGPIKAGTVKQETLGQFTYEIVDTGFGPFDNVGPYLVPDGHFFILGDNRDMSMDSRAVAQVGYISSENITRKVTHILKSKHDPKREGLRLD